MAANVNDDPDSGCDGDGDNGGELVTSDFFIISLVGATLF